MINLDKYINPYVFLISLALGLFYTYITKPETEYIIKYPTPYNAGNILYKDKAGICYRYYLENINCINNIINVPLQ